MAVNSRQGGRPRVRFSNLTNAVKVERYLYVLDSLPAPGIEDAHRQVLATVPGHARRRIARGLRPLLTASERHHSAHPAVLARAIRRAEESRVARERQDASGEPADSAQALWMLHDIDARLVLASAAILPYVAYRVVYSDPVRDHFRSTSESSLALQPVWVMAMITPAVADPDFVSTRESARLGHGASDPIGTGTWGARGLGGDGFGGGDFGGDGGGE